MASTSLLEGKVALVTGSTRGIGWACARLLAEHGATVYVNGRSSQDALAARVDELRAAHGDDRAEGLLFDVADPQAVKAAYQQVFKGRRRLDVLVNNAGILEDALIGMIPPDLVDRTLDVNVAGAIHNLQAAARLMQRARSGSIVNLSSIVGRVGNVGQAVYGASKAALVGLTLSAARELAPSGIRVNAVAPGFIDTDMARQLPPETFAERVRSVRMGRIGTPEDVARVVLFLASDLAGYVTGQVIGVDGGMVL